MPPNSSDLLLTAAITIFVAVAAFQLFIMFARRFLYVCAPNEMLVFSGRQTTRPDGARVGFRIVTGGRAWRVPFIEKVEGMDMRTIPIDIHVSNAYSNGGIPLNVQAVANVKVTNDPTLVYNAVERMLGRTAIEIQQVARETLEGSVRGIIATLTPEQVNEDRLKFAHEVQQEAESDLAKLGIQLDTLKIQAVSDEVNYLNSIGRAQIAELLKQAAIAESNARNEANKRAATATAKADIATSAADEAIIARRNELSAIEAELKAQVRSAQLTATAAAQEARSKAEVKLQEIRRDLEGLRLKADVVLPAEAQREARELLAKGEAAPIATHGDALARSLELMANAWASAGVDARDIYLINQVETLIQTAASALNNIEIAETHVIDSGDGKAIAGLVGAFPQAISSVLGSLRDSTGVNIPEMLSRPVMPLER